jgi:hypothetical protein
LGVRRTPTAHFSFETLGGDIAALLEHLHVAKADSSEPQRFPPFLDIGKMMGMSYDGSADVKKLPVPEMLAFAANDSVSQRREPLGHGRRRPARTLMLVLC